MIFQWNLSDSQSPQVSRTLLSILADLNSAVVWIVSTHPLISKSSSSFIKLLVTVPSASTTNGITVTFYFIIILILASFSHEHYLLVFHWSVSDCKSSQVFQILLSILAILNNAVVCMVSILPLISSSSSLLWIPFQVHQLQLVSPFPHVLQLF